MVCRGENNKEKEEIEQKQKTEKELLLDHFMPTIFQGKVYPALLLIPRWKVTTYKMLSTYIGCKSSQAIGQALTKNQNAPEIPCHRVIKTDGTIGGYAFGIDKKREILASEGVCFDNDGCIVDREKIWDFSETE